jgi:hypothetical protein
MEERVWNGFNMPGRGALFGVALVEVAKADINLAKEVEAVVKET